jgi:ribonuclease BN (tRNA processing enzyme)
MTLLLVIAALVLQAAPQGSGAMPPAPTTQVVLLGVGTPGPDPDRSGPATAIVVNGVPYLVDFGPGVVRRAAEAQRKGVAALATGNLRTAFATHLHSDHTAGLADLILTPWAVGRDRPLELYGPVGLQSMSRHILKAYSEDIRIRIKDKQMLGLKGYREGITVNVHEIRPGVVYRDANVTVTAFPVKHGEVTHAVGYRFQTPDRTIVISGDTSPAQSVIDACNGCDILIHEAYSLATYAKVSPAYQLYRRKHHTSSREVAELATRARPKLLVLYHRANPGGVGMPDPEEAMLQEVKSTYSAPVVTGHDLDVF